MLFQSFKVFRNSSGCHSNIIFLEVVRLYKQIKIIFLEIWKNIIFSQQMQCDAVIKHRSLSSGDHLRHSV